ncbi:MAG TPA: 6-phosphogluconolactonase, partial [Microbacteriaceae bacterium]|nr:6-phosphogluconolactonase [Microbacteriaceae bacterium]
MEIIILPTADEVGRVAARKIAQIITRKPEAVVGLATGSSPVAIYAELAAKVHAGELDASGVRAFALDEYVGIPEEHPQSYASVIKHEVVEPLGM